MMDTKLKQFLIACIVLAIFIVALIVYSINLTTSSTIDMIFIGGSVVVLYFANIYVRKKVDANPKIYTRTLYIGLFAIILFGFIRNFIGF